MSKFIFPFCAGFALAAFSGTTYYVKSSATDWSQPESFTLDGTDGAQEASTLPGQDDTVVVPSVCAYHFTYPSKAYTVVAGVKQVNFQAGGCARFAFDVGADREAVLNAAFFAAPYDSLSYTNCTLVKTGAGTLSLVSESAHLRSNNSWDYYCNLTVSNGTLKLQPNLSIPSAATYMGVLEVAQGACFHMAGGPAKTRFDTTLRGLQGAGIVTNPHAFAATCNVMINDLGAASLFAGDFRGSISMQFSGPIKLTGTGTTTGRNPSIYLSGGVFDYAQWGVTAVDAIGKRGFPSALGTQNISIGGSNGGVLRYDGTGEETDKIFMFYANSSDGRFPSVIDAGATGGLVFKRVSTSPEAPYWTGSGSHNQRVVLTGSNTVPCRVECAIKNWASGGTRTLHIMKRGTGTWRFGGAATNATFGGGISVENGTLQFASLAEKGFASAWGTATNLTRYVEKGTLAEIDASVDYALTLGSTNRNEKGVVEYVGAAPAVCATRRIVLSGTGEIANAGEGVLWLADVTARDADKPATLYLNSRNTKENTLADLTNGVGAIALVKTGGGSWRLARNLDVSSIRVEEGTLVVDNKPDYQWFKLTCKQSLNNDGKAYFPQLQEVALFSEDGVRRNLGMTYRLPPVTTNAHNLLQHEFKAERVFTSDYCDLPRNGVSYASREAVLQIYLSAGNVTDAWPTGNQYRGLEALFDGGWNSDESAGPVTSAGWWLMGHHTTSDAPVSDDPATWVSIVMRTAENTPRITSFDLVSPGGSATGSEVTQWDLEASADGYTWKKLVAYHDASGTSHHKGNAFWYSDWSLFENGSNPNRAGKGFRFGGYDDGNYLAPSWPDLPIALKSGATLRFNGEPVTLGRLSLHVASQSDGRIEGAAFAEKGSLDICGLDDVRALRALPFDFAKCVSAQRLARWTLSFDGEVRRGFRLKVQSGRVQVYSLGTMLFVK